MRTLGDLVAQMWPKGRFLETISTPFGWRVQHVKIDVLPARQLNFEGLGGSGNHQFLRRFVEGVKSALLGGTFADFSDFWVPPGVQMGVHFGSKTHFLVSGNCADFLGICCRLLGPF